MKMELESDKEDPTKLKTPPTPSLRICLKTLSVTVTEVPLKAWTTPPSLLTLQLSTWTWLRTIAASATWKMDVFRIAETQYILTEWASILVHPSTPLHTNWPPEVRYKDEFPCPIKATEQGSAAVHKWMGYESMLRDSGTNEISSQSKRPTSVTSNSSGSGHCWDLGTGIKYKPSRNESGKSKGHWHPANRSFLGLTGVADATKQAQKRTDYFYLMTISRNWSRSKEVIRQITPGQDWRIKLKKIIEQPCGWWSDSIRITLTSTLRKINCHLLCSNHQTNIDSSRRISFRNVILLWE